MRNIFLALFLLITASASAQILQKEKIKVFVDCWCPMDYIKTEITAVDFVLDNKAADVHILITDQRNGGGGEELQVIFYGQHKFSARKDTLRFTTPPNSTDFEEREILVKYLKVGLLPFIAATEAFKGISIDAKKQVESNSSAIAKPTTDNWNYWVFNVGFNGHLNGDKVYKSTRFSGNLSANRITDKVKLMFSLNSSKDKSTYTYEDPNGVDPPAIFINNNHSISFNHQLVKSINDHWSYGYFASVFNQTFSNYKLQASWNPAIEYNVFPYKESNNKFLTIRYGLDVRRSSYYDTTIFGKKNETLAGQGLNVSLSLTQKWGSSSVGLNYHNYFLKNWKYFNLGLNGNINVRITGGLSFNTGVFAGLVRDQLNISGKNATQQDVLTRRRQVASNYNYFSWFGLSYRFGSKLNNFVNPRFESGSGNFIIFN